MILKIFLHFILINYLNYLHFPEDEQSKTNIGPELSSLLSLYDTVVSKSGVM